MAMEQQQQQILKQDGYLDLGLFAAHNECGDEGGVVTIGAPPEARHIVYHPHLNVILAFDTTNQVKILDVHSGVILQTYQLGENGNAKDVCGRYMPLQEKVLFWDGNLLGFRGDYNGVLLLDTILQAPILQNDDSIKVELLLSEAIIFQSCLKDLEQEGLECPSDVSNELIEKIKDAQSNPKKGIKAQRWTTICLDVSYSSLKLVANNVVVMLKRLERHIPVLAIASAINERLTDLLVGSRLSDLSWHSTNFQRVLMHSEAVRRQTFEKWPYMDYKWALPDQMAQAGFYHQPSTSGEDRAMCFTCSVCLVCWEKTDEPWSEHERHSPMCPFVKGEYTQNVPIAVTYATNPAVSAPGPGFDVISNSDYANVLCTSCTQTGNLTIWSIERHLKKMHTLNIATLMKDICDEGYEWARVTAICVLPNERAKGKIASMQAAQTGNTLAVSSGAQQCTSTSTLRAGVVGSKIVLGMSIGQSTGEHLLRMVVLNIIECDRPLEDGLEPTGESVGGGGGGGIVSDGGGIESVGGVGSSNVGIGGSSDSAAYTLAVDLSSQKLPSPTSSPMNNGLGLSSIKKFCALHQLDDNKSLEAAFEKFNDMDDELMKLDHAAEMVHIKHALDDFNEIGSNVLLDEPGTGIDISLATNTNGIEFDTNYIKEKILEAAALAKQNKNNNNIHNTNTDIANNVIVHPSNNNNNEESVMNKMIVNEDIDCVVESCTSVKRMNALSSGAASGIGNTENEFIEITEILPTNGDCQQLLVKLEKTKGAQNENTTQIIMATIEEEDEPMQDCSNMNSDAVAAQLLLFDVVDSVISNEYTLAVTFSHAKCPKQLCLLPPLILQTERRNTDSIMRNAFESGAICVVCADGTMELYSLVDSSLITTISEENEKFVSVAYCRSLDRLCGCTKTGGLLFYTLNDNDNDSGDDEEECCDMEDDIQARTTIAQISSELSVTDGLLNQCLADGGGGSNAIFDGTQSTAGGRLVTLPKLKMDGSLGSNLAAASGSHINTSISPSASSSHAAFTGSLLAFKQDGFSLEDLRTLYALTQFDDKLCTYTAEVPSCWNDLGQAQKQRKQPQNMRNGDDTRFSKTWRLHNDATTYDEHIIELNLIQPVNLGHIDLKFSVYQQCYNPTAIQVTLLKQNTSGFGYRMKGPHASFKAATIDQNMDTSFSDNENPVLNEEYLQTHNAEILAGPIELASCIDLYDHGGTATLTSPKLFKTRTRNFLLHIKTVGDPTKDGPVKSRGCDWLHEISINVCGVKTQVRIPNERFQRIAMLESNLLVQNLFKIASADNTNKLERSMVLDILIWICFIRLNRYRSPKSERIKEQINRETAANNSDLLSQQFECICLTDPYLEGLIRNCIIRGDRSMAHKCVKLMLILTDGMCNLPQEVQIHSTLYITVMDALAKTFSELPSAKYASAVRWYVVLICAMSAVNTHQDIANLCIQMLYDVTEEIQNRPDAYCALLGTRFGLYGFPFDPEIFDYDLPNMSKGSGTSSSSLLSVFRPKPALMQSAGLDINKLSSIDGVDFRTFPHLIKCKSISNQLRGLLEVEQLHFTCVATSEATRIDSLDAASQANTVTTATNVNMDDLIMGPVHANSVDHKDEMSVNQMATQQVIIDSFKSPPMIITDDDLKANGSDPIDLSTSISTAATTQSPAAGQSEQVKPKFDLGPILPKFKAICQFIENCDESSSTDVNKMTILPSADELEQLCADDDDNLSTKVQQYLKNQQQNEEYQQRQQDQIIAGGGGGGDGASNATVNTTFPWHKLLTPPPKQMIVIDRIHSGARRFVVLDFGSPILLTDLVIPACDDLASLFIDIWCFDEEMDSQRLVATPDICTKTLVLSDLQPPPICRYMKITIIGRIGMSSTKCKIPIGCFYGHVVIMDHDGYGDPMLRYIIKSKSNLQAQLKALNSLYEDVNCRYSLASCKLMEVLEPLLHSELSNTAHMQAFINKQREEDPINTMENNRIVSLYDECIMLQHQLNVIRNVMHRLEYGISPDKQNNANEQPECSLVTASRDKLRVISLSLIEILLHFSIDFGVKNILPLHEMFNKHLANLLFHSLVVHGDAHIQLATCSLLVRMCCFQSWWGDFLADLFCELFSAQNSKIFPQDRIFFLLTYLGRRSIAMGTCRSIVIDAVLKTLAKLLAPLSSHYQNEVGVQMNGSHDELWAKTDVQLITWLLLFLSVCLDDNQDRKDRAASRWDFMSCETDFSKTRPQCVNAAGKQLRCFKKRIIQQKQFGVQPYTDWSKKIFMIQNEHPNIFMELKASNKSNKSSSSKGNSASKAASSSAASGSSANNNKDLNVDYESNFDKGLKAIRLNNILIVIRGLIAFLLEMDFNCNMDQFLLTCKVIARLVSACRPVVQLSKIITTEQLEQLVRLSVWNDQQQPWAVHAITCLLQDLLDADKHFKDSDTTPTNECIPLINDKMIENSYNFSAGLCPYQQNKSGTANSNSNNDLQYPDGGVKYSYLPSLIEYDDTEFDEILSDMAPYHIDRSPSKQKKDATTLSKSSFNYFCKSISRAMDARLDIGLELNVETQLRRMTNETSLDMYSSLPQILPTEFVTTPPEPTYWPEYITDIWSGPEYNSNLTTYKMFKNVFDCIFADLHLEDTWVHLEQVLQMWLTLNGELSDKMFGDESMPPTETAKIPFGANAVQGLLLALAWHNDIKLRTWCLGFQCLYLACNTQSITGSSASSPTEEETDNTRINEVIINDENFEKMLLRFFSGYGLSSSIITNRCAGPTICRHLHELFLILYKQSESSEGVLSCKRKLKDTLLHVVLQLVQPGGAINTLHGPIDAQSQMIRDLFYMPTEKADLNVSLNIIECASFLVYNNISNGDKLQCQRATDTSTSSNTFTSLFANVLGSENSKQNTALSDNSLLISLLKLATTLIQTELPRQPSEVPIPEEEELPNESQTDETKAEQLNNEGHRVKTACIADAVLRHFPTMKRLLGALSQCSSNSFSIMASSSLYTVKLVESSFIFDEPQTVPDALFNMLITLNEKASHPRLIVAPLCQYLDATTQQRNPLPRLQLSEPFLWYISKVLEASTAVQIFTQLGGIQIICQNLVKLNRTLINIQPGLISLIMQHMTKNTKCKLNAPMCSHGSHGKKSSSSSSSAQAQRNYHDGLINFAPFCTINSENETAQSAEVLIMNPVAAHRRQRTPAWSYMFYPNESHVDLTIVLPTAILLKEVQLQPHTPTLASCPSAVALEISRDYGVAPIPIGPAMSTTGMTCIRLKLVKPEIATIVVLRLYRPKDSSNIGLTQIAVLGHTIFGTASSGSALSSSNNALINQSGGAYSHELNGDEDNFAKTSVGWIRILARCFNVPGMFRESKLATDVIGASAQYPGFLEACCSLMNLLPLIPNSGLRKLESIMIKLARYDSELSLKLIKILLWKTTPQMYKLSNDSICDLLFEMSTINDGNATERINVLLDWIVNLRHNYSISTLRCNNPQSGYVKVIASILWFDYTENYMSTLPQLITTELFDACMHWISVLENEEPLKIAFDSLLCSFCCIKPELFNELLCRLNVRVVQTPSEESMSSATGTPANERVSSNIGDDDSTGVSMTHDSELTDDKKCAGGSEWFAKVAKGNLATLLSRPSYLTTLAMAAQSPLAIYQLVDSGLPKLLAHALYEFCCSSSPEVKRIAMLNAVQIEEDEIVLANNTETTTSAAAMSINLEDSSSSMPATTAPMMTEPTCLTDSDKAGKCRLNESSFSKRDSSSPSFTLSCTHVPKILEFFSSCCAEGHMRDWLGTQQGSIFWRPLLELLCNYRPKSTAIEEPMQLAFIRMERATINFFTRVCACHPKNQDTLTTLLIAVIRKPELVLMPEMLSDESSSSSSRGSLGSGSAAGGNGRMAHERATISGFTRQLVLQLLLENEKIMVSVRSKKPLKRRDLSPNASSYASRGYEVNMPNYSVQMCVSSNHPAKRISAHHLLFSVSTSSTMRDILQQCGAVTTSCVQRLSAQISKPFTFSLDIRSNDNNNSATMSTSSNLDSFESNTLHHIPLKLTAQQKHDIATGAATPPYGICFPSSSSGGMVSTGVGGFSMKGIENGMEFLSVAAGVTAKDKRLKDVKNQVTAATKESAFPHFKSKFFHFDEVFTPTNSTSLVDSGQFVHPDCPHVSLPSHATIAQLLAVLHSKGLSLSAPCVTLDLVRIESTQTTSTSSVSTSTTMPDDSEDTLSNAGCMQPLPSPLQRFSSRGGLSLLAKYLPTVYPECTIRKSCNLNTEKEKSPPMTDWVKLEPNDDIYEDLEDPITEPITKNSNITAVPQHSLAAFGLFLRLPAYSDVLLRDKYRAQCLLRLVLGVTGDGEGNDIYSLSLAPTLPTLPFEVFRQLLDSAPLTTDDGMLLRRMVIDVGAMYLVLNCLSVFTHQSQNTTQSSSTTTAAPPNDLNYVVGTGGIGNGGSAGAAASGSAGSNSKLAGATNANEEHVNIPTSDDKSHVYWAKGTGFGTGSTTQSWNVEQALMRQKSEEEHVTVLLQVLSSYINPSDRVPSSMQTEDILPYHEFYDGVPNDLPQQFLNLLQQSCLISALSSYLRNDSVLDITRHIPLYRAILQLLRALSLSQQLVTLLQPSENCSETSPSIAELLINMKTCVDTYAKRLKINKKSNLKGQNQQVSVNLDDGDDEGLALLIPDIQETTLLVQKTTNADALRQQKRMEEDGIIYGYGVSNIERLPPSCKSIEQRYLEVMKKLQFDTYDMIVEADNNGYRFTISHHFEKMVRMAGDRYHPSRVKRLAQEAVTLSTSLPLSYSSSVFVRCDTDRLDVMKVLITGPADTPYANGCFEFDVFFPPDYPNLPMMINLETTGRHSVRFNPNLYNDGKVCLSVLNTWHGRPEEKWNAQTSSFLQVLVSIQSLILVPEPYFNEPGFERSRGTPSGTHSSREYNTNIYQACVRWAMLEQIRNPSPCFKDIIHTHFWLKRNEICEQIESWIEELSKPQYSERNSRTISFNSMVLRRQYRHLREELAKLSVPAGLEDLDTPFNPQTTLPAMTETAVQASGVSTATGLATSPASTNTVNSTNTPIAAATIAATAKTTPATVSVAAVTTTTETHNALTAINTTQMPLPDLVNVEAMLVKIGPTFEKDSSSMEDQPLTGTTMNEMIAHSEKVVTAPNMILAQLPPPPPPPGFSALPNDDDEQVYSIAMNNQMQIVNNANVMPETGSDEMDTSSYEDI